MPSNKDYTDHSFKVSLLVIIILTGVMFIPPMVVKGVRVKRANIWSDLIKFDDPEIAIGSGLTERDMEFIREAEKASIIGGPLEHELSDESVLPGGQSWDTGHGGSGEPLSTNEGESDSMITVPEPPDDEGLVRFEDFTSGESPSIDHFSKLLGTATRNRVVRIAFLGDSYIEGDIITADIREQLQQRYGGCGVGFVPFGTPVATGRQTVILTSNGWTHHNLINKRSTPENIREKYAVSGILSTPGRNTWSQYHGVKFRERIDSWTRARFIFVNGGSSTVEITLNDTLKKQFRPESGEHMQQINVMAPDIRKIRFSVDGPEGFIGYGAVMEGAAGISVDNYSIRSNSGLALFGTNASVNAQLRNILGYDMVVLQYGLNAMEPGKTDYSAYGEQLRRVIEYVKSCFPRSTIVVMGVGDRSTQREGAFVTMSAVPAMVAEQRAAAQECGVVFWDTYQAMGGHNSMTDFVRRGWAAKDYTHLGYRGGKHIATEFVRALDHVKYGQFMQDREEELREQFPIIYSEWDGDHDPVYPIDDADTVDTEMEPWMQENLHAGSPENQPAADRSLRDGSDPESSVGPMIVDSLPGNIQGSQTEPGEVSGNIERSGPEQGHSPEGYGAGANAAAVPGSRPAIGTVPGVGTDAGADIPDGVPGESVQKLPEPGGSQGVDTVPHEDDRHEEVPSPVQMPADGRRSGTGATALSAGTARRTTAYPDSILHGVLNPGHALLPYGTAWAYTDTDQGRIPQVSNGYNIPRESSCPGRWFTAYISRQPVLWSLVPLNWWPYVRT